MVLFVALNIGLAVLFTSIWAFTVRRAYLVADDREASPTPQPLVESATDSISQVEPTARVA